MNSSTYPQVNDAACRPAEVHVERRRKSVWQTMHYMLIPSGIGLRLACNLADMAIRQALLSLG
ncbi:hypothetical protein [Erwinia amylovora]|uniref:Uncharacterized protein n=1 Tax=Erwinia amylovora TaxID=552 RepID=A0ABX7MF37_ERWAM|nr:hypothetical protein [Erwinia amylovora]MBZ2390737.1 hypothetical protein [Erwinia amylovora]MBZ2395595.1 hypothetical protein [Erwinia amylovora]MBZ2399127.1 hypothetical protein [Erwinia amylovora]MBZ2403093.1 hypothetical protein [Erwinia amylovora]MCK8157761.1 hypothetical protein [Erwinia amylovora]